MKRLVLALFLGIPLFAMLTQQTVARDLTPDEQIFIGKMTVIAGVLSAAFQYGSDVGDRQDVTDEVWRADYASTWTTFELLSDELEGITPPVAFARSFEEFKTGVDNLAANAPYCRMALVLLVASGISDCAEVIRESNKHIVQATDLLSLESAAVIGDVDAANVYEANAAAPEPTETARLGTCELDSADRFLIQSLSSMLRAGNASPIAWQQMADRMEDADLPTTYSVLRNNVQSLATAYAEGDKDRIEERRDAIAEILALEPCATPSGR